MNDVRKQSKQTALCVEKKDYKDYYRLVWRRARVCVEVRDLGLISGSGS